MKSPELAKLVARKDGPINVYPISVKKFVILLMSYLDWQGAKAGYIISQICSFFLIIEINRNNRVRKLNFLLYNNL